MTIGSHQGGPGKSQVHLTPRWILDPLGPFDLDPCAATVRPWDIAAQNFTEADDGLKQPWRGRVFLNPPFDSRVAGAWVHRLAQHGDGILLIHARTETAWFRAIWDCADAILFLYRRCRFLQPSGEVQSNDSGAPLVLAAFGWRNALCLEDSGLEGALVRDWRARAPVAVLPSPAPQSALQHPSPAREAA